MADFVRSKIEGTSEGIGEKGSALAGVDGDVQPQSHTKGGATKSCRPAKAYCTSRKTAYQVLCAALQTRPRRMRAAEE
jgi:hypothetical protein